MRSIILMKADPRESLCILAVANSKQIAGLVGPTLVAVTGSEMVNPQIWEAVTAPVTYQAGMLLFVAGLSIVRAHNRWLIGWPVVLTLVGWFGVIAGLLRMFVTEAAQRSAANGATALGFEIAILVVGAFLTFKALVTRADETEG